MSQTPKYTTLFEKANEFFLKGFYLRERETKRERKDEQGSRRGRGRGRSRLPSERESNSGLDPRTLKSGPEAPKCPKLIPFNSTLTSTLTPLSEPTHLINCHIFWILLPSFAQLYLLPHLSQLVSHGSGHVVTYLVCHSILVPFQFRRKQLG